MHVWQVIHVLCQVPAQGLTVRVVAVSSVCGLWNPMYVKLPISAQVRINDCAQAPGRSYQRWERLPDGSLRSPSTNRCMQVSATVTGEVACTRQSSTAQHSIAQHSTTAKHSTACKQHSSTATELPTDPAVLASGRMTCLSASAGARCYYDRSRCALRDQ
jgi:hypothetical protein